jgi:hypothetical protein
MRIAIFFLFTALVATAQTSSTLRQKYGQPTSATYKGKPTSETYNVRPGVKVTVSYAKSGDVCAMLIAPLSETENGKPSLLKSQPLDDVIDELVPKDQRGTYLMGTFLNITCLPDNDCYGTNENYKRLSIYRNGSIDAYRYASIHWKHRECQTPGTKRGAITRTQPNKSLDASGGSVFLNLLDAAKGALIRAAASTQPLCRRRFLKTANGLVHDVSTRWSPSRATDDGFVEMKYCGRALCIALHGRRDPLGRGITNR